LDRHCTDEPEDEDERHELGSHAQARKLPPSPRGLRHREETRLNAAAPA
jgi:hypothetical protein